MKTLFKSIIRFGFGILGLVLFGLPMEGKGQINSKYFVPFTDKDQTPYSLSDPQQFLSDRAIQRRQNQNIALDWYDLPVDPNYVQQVAATGVTVIARSKWLNGVIIQTLDANALAAVQALPFVVNYQPVAMQGGGNSQPKWKDLDNQASFKVEQDWLESDYGASYNQLNMVGALGLHNAGFKGQGKLIAVLDAGFPFAFSNPGFDSLNARNGITMVKDIVTPGGDPTVSSISAHGAYVLSIIAGHLPGQLIGSGPDADFALIRTEDAGTENIIEEYNWVIGAELADSLGADIINSSLGYNLFDQSFMNHSFSDMDGQTNISSKGANKAASKGILVVVSQGNEGNSAWGRVVSPADADSALAVGGVDSLGNHASLSGRGPAADGAIKPNVSAKGFKTSYITTQGEVLQGNGTSFASPIISGLAACLWQALPTLTAWEMKNLIEQCSSQYNEPDSLLGYGIPNFSYALILMDSPKPQSALSDELLFAFPNPFDGELDLRFYSTQNQLILIEVCDLLGKSIYKSAKHVFHNAINTIHLDLPVDLEQGLYQVSIKTEKGNYTAKVLKFKK
ncbi:MAG: S8 family peptidase [Bacteroidia bacterium]|nr:S8 family peptidase [Bacteroidia bacterium]